VKVIAYGAMEKLLQRTFKGLSYHKQVSDISVKFSRNDDLHFDYKLRDGICENKKATFLNMKK
jgi:hypothetical protein